MKQYVKKTVVFILTASLMLLTGCQQPFDATGYTQAVLDMVTRGETKAYEAISESSEEEAKKQYEAAIDSYMQEFDSLGFSDELTEKYRSYIPNLMQKTKYTVQEAKEQDDGSFEVGVEVEPIIMFGGIEELLQQKLQDYLSQVQNNILNNQAAPTDEEMTEAAGEMLYECLNTALEDPQYGDKTTITVHVQESETENVWEIPGEDVDALMTALIDTTGAEEAFTLS
ncbi:MULTISPECIES: hypothetical protein [Clostridia]|uniref:DUF5105 domain-containing protein n=1 Tax=Sellimonas catena TaxID=2994035 RepID=A0A9W6CAD4_9FIRM|nr:MULTISPECIES: hypothetical protein [Clostridia]GLG88950.1 hypothetical protein Selli2_03760 [Sellimonas catena]